MFAIRYVVLATLVVWIAALLSVVAGDFLAYVDTVTYTASTIILIGLLLMKFVGPPPHGFVPRVLIVAAMLALALFPAIFEQLRLPPAMHLSVDVTLGFVLLAWYVRE
jgi:hypothetical protein